MAVIEKAIIPAAGRGTRFLPQTKASPKEMLPLVDKPIIQRVVEELVDVGVREIVIVTGEGKRAIEEHFNVNPDLEKLLIRTGKQGELDQVRRISKLAQFTYIDQKGPVGNATPILNARLIMDGPSYVFWGDDFIDATPSRARQLLSVFNKYHTTILGAIESKSKENLKKYAFIRGQEVGRGIFRVESIVEKPGARIASRDLAIVSGFVTTPDIYPHLEAAAGQLPEGQELVYTVGIQGMIDAGIPVYATVLKNARYFDTGSKLGYLEAVIHYGLKHPELGQALRAYLEKELERDGGH